MNLHKRTLKSRTITVDDYYFEKRFDVLTGRMDSFMKRSFGMTLTCTGLIIAAMKLWKRSAGKRLKTISRDAMHRVSTSPHMVI